MFKAENNCSTLAEWLTYQRTCISNCEKNSLRLRLTHISWNKAKMSIIRLGLNNQRALYLIKI